MCKVDALYYFYVTAWPDDDIVMSKHVTDKFE
jgi:hypothetical protein